MRLISFGRIVLQKNYNTFLVSEEIMSVWSTKFLAISLNDFIILNKQ